ncbi:VOC family protein [Achromobacter sp. Marseille-Q4962]|uniref:VOC family protein n=1 Tax=Achromobacter sp. Marseille-Q4962 TaxID=2942202 RepID=UPI0020742024|nr:VOC family protein [Achromobacter sp. Marseille-Q4962]
MSHSSSIAPDGNYVLLYVDKPEASAAFYSALLARSPIERSPTFALFALDTGLKLGLWSRHTVEPAPAGRGGGAEIGFRLPDADAVNRRHRDWSLRGLAILQPPTDMDFGRSFVALDPDGHRLRVFSLAPEIAQEAAPELAAAHASPPA